MKAASYCVILFVSLKTLEALTTTLISLKECKKPVPPVMADLSQRGYFKIEAYQPKDKVLVKGNVTLFQDAIFLVQIGSKNVNFRGISCKHLWFKVLLNFVKLKYHPATCVISQGSYFFDGLDSEVVDKRASFLPARNPGVNSGYISIYGKEGTYFCYDIKYNVTK